MNSLSNSELQSFKDFLTGKTGERVFICTAGHPSQPTGFCPCDQALLSVMWFYFKATLLAILLKLPFNSPKNWLLRKMGARIGQNVFISVDVWIDPAFPQLLTIEDNVMIGVGAKIAMHEFSQDQFRAGRVTIRKRAIIGGFSLIGCGIEIGEGATVAGGAAVQRDVPANKIAIGNPARILQQKSAPPQTKISTEHE